MPTTLQRTLGRYRLESLVGTGGMAEVYRATDTRLDRTVAIKMILPSLVSQPSFLQRFLREARLVAALEHPNILPIYDFGEEDGAPYLVTPLMTGGTLAQRVGLGGLPPQQVVHFVAQLAGALDTAHEAGILHRDVKPGNVLMDRNGRPVLADFGLARVAGASSDLTATGVMVGTPLYMAPELAQGSEASPSTDLYALGVLAYQMLCGATPFHAEAPVAVLHQHVTGPVPPLSQRVSGLPLVLDDVLERALAKRADDRYSSGAELTRALLTALDCATPAPISTAVPSPPSATDPDGRSWSHSEALIDGSLTVTPVPRKGPAPDAGKQPTVATGKRWSIAFVILFALLGIMLGARSFVGRAERPPEAAVRDSGAGRRSSAQLPGRPRPLDREDFEQLAVRAATGLSLRPDDPATAALAAYAKGGLAYSSGDDETARQAIDRVRTVLGDRATAKGLPTWIAGGRTAGSVADWELAAIYGDARKEGLSLVDARLAEAPADSRARLGRALLLHLAGRHEDAVSQAVELQARVPGSNRQVAGQVLRFVADEYVELGRWEDAVRTYGQVAELGGTAAAQAGMDGGRIALERLGDDVTARELFRAACDAGNQLACRRAPVTRSGRSRSASR